MPKAATNAGASMRRLRAGGAILVSAAAVVSLSACGSKSSEASSSATSVPTIGSSGASDFGSSMSAQASKFSSMASSANSDQSAAAASSAPDTAASTSSVMSSGPSATGSIVSQDLNAKLLTTIDGSPVKKLDEAQLERGLNSQAALVKSAQVTPATCGAVIGKTPQPAHMSGGSATSGGAVMVVSLASGDVNKYMTAINDLLNACRSATISVAGQKAMVSYTAVPKGNASIAYKSSTKVATNTQETVMYAGVKNGVLIQTMAMSKTGGPVTAAIESQAQKAWAEQAAKV